MLITIVYNVVIFQLFISTNRFAEVRSCSTQYYVHQNTYFALIILKYISYKNDKTIKNIAQHRELKVTGDIQKSIPP